MEQNNLHCTLNDKELIEMAEAAIQDLIDTGGKSFTMRVPARPNQDTDLILSEIVNRFKALQAKCERYEKALNAIIGRNMPVPNKADMIKIVREALGLDEGEKIANKALSGEGEEEPNEGKIMVCNNSDVFRYWAANIKGYRIAHKGHITEIWLPIGMTSEAFAKEWGEYENANNLTNQKEDK